VIDRQSALIVEWLRVGFIHGVMNTDNMSLCGETIDYGPCAFLERYDPGTAFSSIDHAKRYAFNNQPSIAQWNLARFAEALLPAIDSDPDQALALAEAAINRFADLYRARQVDMMRGKLGLCLAFRRARILRCLLGLILGLLGGRGGHDAVIMFRMLKIVLGHHAVATGIGVAGELQIFFVHMAGRAANLDFRSAGIIGAVGIEAATAAAIVVAAAATTTMLRPAAAST